MEDHNYYQTEEKFEELLSVRLRQEEEEREETKVYLGAAFPRWTSLKRDKSFRSDAEVACFLLDSYERAAMTSAPTKEKPFQVKAPAVSGTSSFSNGANRFLCPRTTNGVVMPPAISLQPADPKVLNWVVLVPSPTTSGLIHTQVRRDVQDAPPESTVSQSQQVPDHFHLQKEREEDHIKQEQEERCIKQEHEEHCIKEDQEQCHIKKEQEEHHIEEAHNEWHVKEEQEEHRIKKELEKQYINGEEVEVNLRIKEADTRFPLTSVLVKSENDEKKPQSPQLHQSPAEENREVELPTSRPGKRMKIQAEDYGGRKQARNGDLNSCLPPNTDGKDLDFAETEDSTEHDDGNNYWQEPISASGPETEDGSSEDSNLQGPLSESGSETEDSGSEDSDLHGPLSESGSETEDSSSEDSNLHGPLSESGSETEDSSSEDSNLQGSLSESGSETEDSSSDENRQEPLLESRPKLVNSDSGWRKTWTSGSGVNMDVGCSTAQKPFSSTECGKQFLYKQSLQKHTTFHSGKKSSAALDKKCVRVKPSTNGQKQFHTQEKLLNCKICRRILDRSRLLKTQRTPQSGQTVCNFCEKRFRCQT